jgi:hypothetical protein
MEGPAAEITVLTLAARLEAQEARLTACERGVGQLARQAKGEKMRSKWPERDDLGPIFPRHDELRARVTMPAIGRDPPEGAGRARHVP